MAVNENTKIKEWYMSEFPTDSLGQELNDNVTFYDMFKYMDNYKDIYELVGIGDSVVRERCFTKLAEIMISMHNGCAVTRRCAMFKIGQKVKFLTWEGDFIEHLEESYGTIIESDQEHITILTSGNDNKPWMNDIKYWMDADMIKEYKVQVIQ